MQHQDITFRLRRLEPRAGSPGALRGIGVLQIAGVEREVALDLTTAAQGRRRLTVHGELQLLMTDFGITPPKAMLGMLKTDPKVTITFDTRPGRSADVARAIRNRDAFIHHSTRTTTMTSNFVLPPR